MKLHIECKKTCPNKSMAKFSKSTNQESKTFAGGFVSCRVQ